MKINVFVEDFSIFRYIGCATAARTLYKGLLRRKPDDVLVTRNSKKREFDLTSYHTFGPFALNNRRKAKGIKVLSAHSTPRLNAGNVSFSRQINSMYPRIYSKFDHIITISEPSHREIIELLPDMDVTYIPNGIDRDYFSFSKEKRKQFRESYGIEEDDYVVLSVGQQVPRKGIYDFLELSRESPDRKFVWVGGYPYGMFSKEHSRIEKAKRSAGDNVIFTGIVDDISAAYSAGDVFLMASHAESFGLVIIEALSCGIPVIARDINEFREIFGGIVHMFGERDDAAAIIGDERMLKISANNARESTKIYDINLIADRHLTLYRELAGT